MEYIIGIDIGTGSTKAVALDINFKPVDSSQFFYPTTSPEQSYSEQNPLLIWGAFINCINELQHKLKAQPLTIGLSSAMHSLIMVDGRGEALAPLITWADGRSSEEASLLRKSDEGIAVYRATGTPIHAMSPLCKIMWLQKNAPALIKRTEKFISIKEYIWFKLFGEYAIDQSIASATGLFNIHRVKWNEESLRLAGIEAENLSQIHPTDYSNKMLLPEAAALLNGLNTTFVIGASDGCMANLGSEATEKGIAAITIGTSGAFRMASEKPVFNAQGMPFSYILDRNTFICGGPVNNGGIALQWLIKNIFEKTDLKAEDYRAVFDLVGSVPAGSNGLIFLPYLSGERAPIWDSEACGTFFGLNLTHKKAHMAKAVIEGICFALNDVLKSVEGGSGNVKQVNISGGFVHSKEWMQILADVTGKKLVMVLQEDASAVGAAYLAAKSIRLSEGYPVVEHTKPETILPNHKNHLHYQETFLIFKQLYASLSTSMQQLHRLKL